MNETDVMMRDIEMEIALTRELTGKKTLNPRVLSAMRTVPRHEFIPQPLRYRAYDNGPLPIGLGQTISQPYIVALMSDLVNPEPEDIILEIGTGSGYQTSILSLLVKQVYSVEIIAELSQQANERLHKLGYQNVSCLNSDGYFGWLEHAPYDGIIVTAAAPHIPQPLLEQLRVGARLVIPVGHPHDYQELKVLEKTAVDKIVTHTILAVSFVPLTGDHHNATAYHDRFNR